MVYNVLCKPINTIKPIKEVQDYDKIRGVKESTH